MGKPWDVTGQDIAEWAARYDAPAVLPVLVRRLLAATTPLDGLEMRADAGVRLGGWDGTVVTRDGNRWCPPGLSAWELSVEADAKGKLDRDFEKRTKAPPEPIRPKLATYVAVVARRVGVKERWVKEKKALGAWRDVWLLDADDLATWLEAAPAVGRWFAGILGKPSADLTDLEAFLEAWSRRTDPPLPWDLVLAGEDRREKAAQIVTWLTYPPARPLHVRAASREEAMLFAAAAMAKGLQAERWLGRALVAETEEAWRWALAAQRAEPLVVMPAFEGADPGKATGRAHAILALDKSAPGVPGATVDLDVLPYKPLERRLVDAGRPDAVAEDLVRRSGGSLVAMQRLSGYVELPGWAKNALRPELMAFLLAGAWVPRNEKDREVIRRLGGSPEELERLCGDLEQRGEVVRAKETWAHPVLRWRSHEDAWRLLAPGVTDTMLVRFREVVMEVLGTPVTAPSMQEQFEAAVHGKALQWSGEMRTGLAESIARLAVHEDVAKDAPGLRHGGRVAAHLVSRLLDPERGWSPWASLSQLLPILAEASPEVFLGALEKSLDRGEAGASHILSLESKNGLSGAPHTGLLRALEVLSWCPSLTVIRRVAFALATLAARDPGGALSHRPLNTLVEMLHFGMPQSATTAQDRVDLVRAIFRRDGAIGWDVALYIARSLVGMRLVTPAQPPRFRDWSAAAQQGDEDPRTQVEAIVDGLLAYAGQDPVRWAALIEPARHMGYLEDKVLDALESARPGLDDTEMRVWAALRRRLSLAYLDKRDVGAQRQARLASLYHAFAPADVVMRVAWLFGPYPDLPDPVEGEPDVKKKRRRFEELEDEAVTGIWASEGGPRMLARLASVVRNPFVLGFTLGKAPFAEELEAWFFDEELRGDYARMFPGFAAYWAYNRADKGFPWLEATLRKLVEADRGEDAVAVLLTMQQGAPVWDMVESLGESVSSIYWKNLSHVFVDRAEDSERAIAKLLQVGREPTALEAASWSKGSISSATALLVLERLGHKVNAAGSEVDVTALRELVEDYEVDRVFEIVDRDTTVDAGRAFAVELSLWPFLKPLPFLEEQKRPARYISAMLGREPSFFVQLLAMLAERGSEEQATLKPRADFAGHILEVWRGYPGEDLAGEERDSRLQSWASDVLAMARAQGLERLASIQVAEVLARAPNGDDGIWPCVAARRLIESRAYDELAADVHTAQWNSRGWTSRGLMEGGAQEIEIAEVHRAAAEQIQQEYPRTAAMLDSLARSYEAQAEQHDATAKQRHIEHGEDVEDPSPPTPVPPSEPPGLLTRIQVQNVGPARSMEIDIAPRLNLFLGDNSAGKTFALEILWWALTGTWTSRLSRPRPFTNGKRQRDATQVPSITVVAGERRGQSVYDPAREHWSRPFRTPPARGVAVYARVDGGFSIWDPVRNAKPRDAGEIDLSEGYHFSQDDLWSGKRGPDGMSSICHGILEDAVIWKSEHRDAYKLLERALTLLSPPGEPIQLGLPQRFTKGEDRKFPTVLMPWGPVFAMHVSAAIKRALGLAYALAWGFTNYVEAARLAKVAPVRRVTMLVDEVEAHLHPKWQRQILLALLGVSELLDAEVQLVVTTHAPMVVASVEPHVADDKDALFQFSMPEQGAENRDAEVRRVPWLRHADANAVLSAEEIFDTPPRGIDVQAAIDEASRALSDPKTTPEQGRAIDRQLRALLGDMDPFWIRWRYMAEKRGWLRDPGHKKTRAARL